MIKAKDALVNSSVNRCKREREREKIVKNKTTNLKGTRVLFATALHKQQVSNSIN